MPLTTVPLPYGLRDIKVATLTTAGVKGALVDLPNARTFSFSESEEFSDLRGDDHIVATRGMGPEVAWDLESGGISFEATVIMNGGTIVESGTTPASVKKYTKKTTDSRPYFYVEGQAISDSGGDFHVVLYRCKATDKFEGELADGSFWLTAASGKALGSTDATTADVIYEFVQNEAVTAIA
jgi:hypothetical protein